MPIPSHFILYAVFYDFIHRPLTIASDNGQACQLYKLTATHSVRHYKPIPRCRSPPTPFVFEPTSKIERRKGNEPRKLLHQRQQDAC